MSFFHDLEKIAKKVATEVEHDLSSIDKPVLDAEAEGVPVASDSATDLVHGWLKALHVPEGLHHLILQGAIISLQEVLDFLKSQNS